MFGFRKKEKSREELLAVVDGTLIPIEDVKDPVFSFFLNPNICHTS